MGGAVAGSLTAARDLISDTSSYSDACLYNSGSSASNGWYKMDFTPIWNRFGQPFRPDLSVD